MTGAWREVAALCLLSAGLGTVHAFSVFVVDLEAKLGADRSDVALVYSVALVGITIAVLGVGRLPSWGPARAIPAAVGGVAAVGLLIASASASLAGVLLGYGIVFGLANGVGYAFALEAAGTTGTLQTRTARMALVTAAYAAGAAAAAPMLTIMLRASSVDGALRALAGTMLLIGAVSTTMLRHRVGLAQRDARAARSSSRGSVIRLWFGYGLGVLAGLLALGHAAALLGERSTDDSIIAGGTAMIAVANAVGGVRVALGSASSRVHSVHALPVLSFVGLVALIVWDAAVPSLLALTLVGYAYGALIAAYPPLVADVVGMHAYPRAYGRVFTAWGLAGLVGPLSAGALFDRTGSYTIPLAFAAVAAIASSVVAHTDPSVTRLAASSPG